MPCLDKPLLDSNPPQPLAVAVQSGCYIQQAGQRQVRESVHRSAFARLTRHTRTSFPTDGGHTIMLAFERQAVDSWAITTINTGEGCNSYHMQLGGDERYKTKIKAAVRIEGVPASRILHPLALWLLLRLNDASRPSHQHKPSVYDRNSTKFGQCLGTNGEPHATQQTGFTKSSSHSSPAATCATLYKPRAPTLAPTGSLRNELEHATTAVC